MTSFKQNKFSPQKKTNSSYLAPPLTNNLTTSQTNKDLDKITIGKEAIRWERIGLLEDKCLQELCKSNRMPIF